MIGSFLDTLMFGMSLKYGDKEYKIVKHSVGYGKTETGEMVTYHLVVANEGPTPSPVLLVGEISKADKDGKVTPCQP